MTAISPDLNELGKEFIDHSGVKGMKWGVRRSKSELGRGKGGDKGGKKEKKEQYTGPNSRHQTKSIGEMSDKDLKAYVNRINLEQQYARLQPTPFSKKAQKFVTDIVVGVAKQQITNALSNEVSSQIGLIKNKRAGIPAPPNPLLREGPRLITPPKLGTRVG